MGVGDTFALITVMATLFIALPWIVFHYITLWKSKPSLSIEDEKLLDGLYELGRRLEDRVGTIERIMTAENPGWRQLTSDPTGSDLQERLSDRRNVQ